jgi:hypothetical protein
MERTRSSRKYNAAHTSTPINTGKGTQGLLTRTMVAVAPPR